MSSVEFTVVDEEPSCVGGEALLPSQRSNSSKACAWLSSAKPLWTTAFIYHERCKAAESMRALIRAMMPHDPMASCRAFSQGGESIASMKEALEVPVAADAAGREKALCSALTHSSVY